MTNDQVTKGVLVLLGLAIFVVAFGMQVKAAPGGATITNISHDTGPTITPDNRSDAGGTINTVNLDSTQQNANWKAYVGNVTGSLTLDDGSQNTIYDWNLNSISGEVYLSRNSSVDWSSGSISCASESTVSSEESALGFSSGEADTINATYNASTHSSMQVGENSINADNCKTAYTYTSDSSQAPSQSNNFTAILLEDSGSNLVYASFLEQDVTGFDGSSTYDYQVIVPDNENATSNTYYFYLELS